MFRTRELYTHALHVVRNITSLTVFLGKSRRVVVVEFYEIFGFCKRKMSTI